MTALGIDITLHYFSLAMVLGFTGIGLAALPWSNAQTREVEVAFMTLARLCRGWLASRLKLIRAARTTSDWRQSSRVCVS